MVAVRMAAPYTRGAFKVQTACALSICRNPAGGVISPRSHPKSSAMTRKRIVERIAARPLVLMPLGLLLCAILPMVLHQANVPDFVIGFMAGVGIVIEVAVIAMVARGGGKLATNRCLGQKLPPSDHNAP
jgi:hypothetical protein